MKCVDIGRNTSGEGGLLDEDVYKRQITSGVKLINLKEHEEVASIAKVRRASGELEENAEETAEETLSLIHI